MTWEDKLNRINALFDVWIDVQRRWAYLEGIFMGEQTLITCSSRSQIKSGGRRQVHSGGQEDP